MIFDPISNGVNKIGDFFLLPLSLCIVHSTNIIPAIFQLFNSAKKQTIVSISVSRGSKNRCKQRQITENSLWHDKYWGYILFYSIKSKNEMTLIYSKKKIICIVSSFLPTTNMLLELTLPGRGCKAGKKYFVLVRQFCLAVQTYFIWFIIMGCLLCSLCFFL